MILLPVTDGADDRVPQLYGHLQCCGCERNCSVTKYHLSQERWRDIIYWSAGVYSDIIHVGNQGEKLSTTSVLPHSTPLHCKALLCLTCHGQEPLLVS